MNDKEKKETLEYVARQYEAGETERDALKVELAAVRAHVAELQARLARTITGAR